MTKVSVIVPIYNAEQYLSQCLQSLLETDLQETEFILVNDGSTDQSAAIAYGFVQQDPRFQLLQQENGGSAAARRNGMLAATGEYIGFLDADDWVEPDMYARLYHAAKENDVDIVFCNCYRESATESRPCKKYLRNGYFNRQQIIDEILSNSLAGIDHKGRNQVIRWANYLRLYRRALLEQHQIYNDPRFRRCQDLQITFEATLHANSYYYLGDDYLYHNRVVTNSQSRGYTRDFWEKLRILIEKLYQDVEEYGDAALLAQMDLCAFFFATQACSNEAKHPEGLLSPVATANLKKVLEDPLLVRCLPSIPVQRLNSSNRLFYTAFQTKNQNKIYTAIQEEFRQEKRNDLKVRLLQLGPVRWLHSLLRKIK